jgi:aspartyl-tRNA(Asn)/glutamyl-tRNA(Gln) amidotransferase subunit C
MKINSSTVERIAMLARLGLTKEEATTATQQLTGILDHFSLIQNIDTKKTAIADDVTGLHNITRDDKPQHNNLCTTEDLLSAAPEVHKKHIKVEAVL